MMPQIYKIKSKLSKHLSTLNTLSSKFRTSITVGQDFYQAISLHSDETVFRLSHYAYWKLAAWSDSKEPLSQKG
jgi:hypothetical protein